MEAIVLEAAHGFVGLAAANNHRVDFAGLQFLHRDALLDVNHLRLHPESLEHRQRGDERAAIGKIDADGLAIELPQIVHRLGGDDVHLLVVELGHVGELLLDVLREAFSLEIVQCIGPHDSEVNALEKQDVGDALHRAAPDDGKHAQLVSVIEHGGEVRAELHVGAADRARDQRHRVLVQALLGLGRAQLKYRLEAFADFGGVIFGFLGLR